MESEKNLNEAPIEEKDQFKPVEVQRGRVIVMGVEIPRNPEPGPRTPNGDKFKNFVEDEYSLGVLQKIAKGAVLDVPTMLEGEAAVGKSTSIEYLAFLTNNEVYRMSLNGQTDTTDLIGKWVPKTEEWRKDIEDLLRNPKKCKDPKAREFIESQQIKVKQEAKEEAVKAGRTAPVYFGFSKEDMMGIAKMEGIKVSETDWVWQDGEVPRQIENGAWTVLDEINTCEPQILVRLNSILEGGGQLVLHEDGSRIPKPKDPSKKHMLFATCNPPGGKYRGRVPLSAEMLSRWNYHNLGELPVETDIYREKIINGVSVEMSPEALKSMQKKFVRPEFLRESMVDAFGKEWVSNFTEKYVTAYRKLAEMAKANEIGKDQEQKFDFDQRDKERFRTYIMKFHERGRMKKTIEDAVEYVFLGKMKSPRDRQKARDVVLGLIKVAEPKEKEPSSEQQQKKHLRALKADIVGMNIPESHRKALFGS